MGGEGEHGPGRDVPMPSSRSRRARANLSRRSSAAAFTGTQHNQPNETGAATTPKPFVHRAYSSTGVDSHDENGHLYPHPSNYDNPGPPGLSRPSSGRRLTYSSLPSTPVISSPPEIPGAPRLHYPVESPTIPPQALPETEDPVFSLWDYLREELLATDFESHQELKWDRVSNFLSIPWAMEKVSTKTPTALTRS